MKQKSTPWTPKRLLLLAGLIGACTQLGHLWTFANWIVGSVPTAYAAKQTADQTANQFERYLDKQDAVADALNKYVANQQQQAQLPNANKSVIKEWDGEVCWECATDRETCWRDQTWRRCP